jgi:hypothetical protein
MRVLHLLPWEPRTPFDGRAGAQLAYFRDRGWEVECVAFGDRHSRVPGVRAVHRVEVPGGGATLRDRLFAFARAADGRAFRAVAARPFDLLFANGVPAAAFAVKLPRGVRKVVAAGGLLAAASTRSGPLAAAESEWVFRHVEAELYRAFDAAAISSEADVVRLREAGYAGASHVPEPLPVRPVSRAGTEEYDVLAVGSGEPHELRELERFYRHVYLPFLRPYRIRLAVAGPLAERFAVADACVTRLGSTADWPDGKVVVVTEPVRAGALDSPADAFVAADMTDDPAGSAAKILERLRDEPRRSAVRKQAAERIARTHSPEAFAAGMDAVVGVARRAA